MWHDSTCITYAIATWLIRTRRVTFEWVKDIDIQRNSNATWIIHALHIELRHHSFERDMSHLSELKTNMQEIQMWHDSLMYYTLNCDITHSNVTCDIWMSEVKTNIQRNSDVTWLIDVLHIELRQHEFERDMSHLNELKTKTYREIQMWHESFMHYIFNCDITNSNVTCHIWVS